MLHFILEGAAPLSVTHMGQWKCGLPSTAL